MKRVLRWHASYFGTWEEFWRPLFRVALPIVAQGLVSSSLLIVNNLMVGALGDMPLAGVAQANRFAYILRLFLFGISSGMGILVAQRWGNRDAAGVRRSLGIAALSTLVVSLLGFSLAAFAPRLFLSLMIRDEGTMTFAIDYMRMIAPSFLFMAVSAPVSLACKSTERTLLPMIAGIAAIIVNSLLNWCLIYGNLGLPSMGVSGAGLATSIAGGLECVILLAIAWGRRYPIAGRLRDMLPASPGEVAAYYKVALPVIANEGLWAVGVSLYGVVYGIMGTTAIAAMAIFDVIDQFIWAVGWGFMTAAAVLVGKRLGADDIDGAGDMARRLLTLSVIASLVMGLGMVLPLRQEIVGMFNASAEAKAMAANTLIMFSGVLFVKIFNAVNVVGVLRSGGDSLFTMTLDVGGVWLIGLPMVFLAGVVLKLPLQWVYLMAQVEEVIKFFIGFRRYRSRKWAKRLVPDLHGEESAA